MSGGPALSFQECLITSQGDGPALSNSTTATSILPTAARFTLPANFFWTPGKMLRVKALGRVSTFTSGTLTLAVNLGTIASPITAFTSQAISMTASQTNLSWDLEIDLTCRAIGNSTSANLIGIGRLLSAAAAATVTLLPASAPAVGTGFDSTTTNVVDLFATWSVANASNSITCHQFSLESLN